MFWQVQVCETENVFGITGNILVAVDDDGGADHKRTT